jgi:hypothetical protein
MGFASKVRLASASLLKGTGFERPVLSPYPKTQWIPPFPARPLKRFRPSTGNKKAAPLRAVQPVFPGLIIVVFSAKILPLAARPR